ncbi:alpha/beta hydrolase [Geobacter sp. SVR]|uniref:alpha/beta hydrolase n=1 Tax=Geobacter sp. SVR TaxID=2495594 RepID=UPI00143F022D|nr:alpha/beta hydrolase [Geobacter sp. SVR]BCS55314.1 alpha/beta hydrolase [Geobacter sp. SVR]GCF87239.1 alpha/beta hydrolase [Geobacter sp. SVR]
MILHIVQRCIIVTIPAYLGYVLLVFLLQRQILYPGRFIQVPPGHQPPAGVEALELAGAAGRGKAWLMPPLRLKPGERRPLLIFFHGNGEVIDVLPEQMEGFRRMGMGVLLVEYPGYGGSPGSPSEEILTGTALAAYDAVAARPEVDPAWIVIFGRSLGGGPACALAARRPSRALILQSTFTSTRPFARRFLVPGFLVRDTFDNAAVLAQYRQPVLLMHGSRDTTVPPWHSRRLAQLAPHARLIEYPCGHNDFPPDWDQFYRQIAGFLKDAGVGAVD